MWWLLILVIWPLAEIFVMIKVAEAIGLLWMLLLLVVSWPIGTRILRTQGRAAWRRFVDAVQAGRVPAEEALNGALVLLGGLLLLVPGFITDAIGLLLLIPPTRLLARRAVARHSSSGWVNRVASFGGGFASSRQNPGGREDKSRADYDVDSTAVDIDNQELEP